MEEGWIRLERRDERIGGGKRRGSSSYRLCPRCCFWDGESVQGSITGIKRRSVFLSVTKMDIEILTPLGFLKETLWLLLWLDDLELDFSLSLTGTENGQSIVSNPLWNT